ncbi:unnamed protein product [Clavelina lepadiformis]|uniref:glycerophosphodiester phosphodiesterase n=1 Tax=Clavelina lepadiformis TaxID=159417 RepID=A0ABP0G324_CLALP
MAKSAVFILLATCVASLSALSPLSRSLDGLPADRPLNIAHRGSSGMLPEHTVEAYQLAVQQGADVIECDLAVTKDLLLVCTHDSWLNDTTDVASHLEFRDRVQTYRVDGRRITDYFTIDFTLDELKTLRKKQDRSYRDQTYNGEFPMASFDEYVAVAKNVTNGRTIGIYPETKNPDFFNSILAAHNTTMEEILLESLQRHGYTEATSPCFVQSFDEDSLRFMSGRTELPLIYLTPVGLTNTKLAEISTFCSGLGTSKDTIVQVNPNTMKIIQTSDFIDRAHSYQLEVHAYTFRNEDQFLARDYGSDPYREYEMFVEIGVDGLFTDFPWSLSRHMEYRALRGSAISSHRLPYLALMTALTFAFSFNARY